MLEFNSARSSWRIAPTIAIIVVNPLGWFRWRWINRPNARFDGFHRARGSSLARMFSNVISWFRRQREARRAALMFERQVIVKFDDAGIAAAYPGGEIQAISWSEVQCVAIETNHSGPWGADVWWLLEGGTKRCAYPGGATGEQEALTEYPKRFHGFSDAAVIKAMGSTSNARFVCWQRIHTLTLASASSSRAARARRHRPNGKLQVEAV